MDKWLAVLVRLVLERISPEIAALIKQSLQDAKKKAAETDNPFDDLLVDILIWVTGTKT
jgi:hypothetical protein